MVSSRPSLVLFCSILIFTLVPGMRLTRACETVLKGNSLLFHPSGLMLLLLACFPLFEANMSFCVSFSTIGCGASFGSFLMQLNIFTRSASSIGTHHSSRSSGLGGSVTLGFSISSQNIPISPAPFERYYYSNHLRLMRLLGLCLFFSDLKPANGTIHDFLHLCSTVFLNSCCVSINSL